MESYFVCNADGAYAVACDNLGRREYVGRDGYWARQPENCTPFTTRGEAAAEVEKRQHERSRYGYR